MDKEITPIHVEHWEEILGKISEEIPITTREPEYMDEDEWGQGNYQRPEEHQRYGIDPSRLVNDIWWDEPELGYALRRPIRIQPHRMS